ncbi:MAG TPA: phytanoyl-CoA dioxygenase family protein [Chloroflexota bacterium]|nr:phytanoyl-CoA dioxygenase family protein [Chloroflexota bacterium]
MSHQSTQVSSTSTSLSPEQAALLPGDEDIALYQERGYYLSPVILSDEQINAAVAGSERFYTGTVTDPGIEALARYRPSGTTPAGLRKNDYASFFCPELATLTRQPIIGAIAACLTGSPSIRLWHDQLLYKPTDRPEQLARVGWHTDRQYWLCCSSDAMLTAWIPFHDCDEEMGSIAFVEGSQHWTEQSKGLNFFSNDLTAIEEGFASSGRPVVKTTMTFRKGQVSFHNCRTIHGSGPNRRREPRRAIAVHLQDEANSYREYVREDGQLARHANNALCRQADGFPDYTDPTICPLLYQR